MNKLALLVLLPLLIIGVNAANAQSTAIYLQGDVSTICNGPVDIYLMIENIPPEQPLQGFDVRIAYDSSSVSATAAFETEVITPGITFRNAVCGPNIDYPVEDSCAYSTSAFGVSTAINDGKLAKITLTNAGANASSLQIYEYPTGGGLAGTPELSDPVGFPIDHAIGASIDILGCPSAVGLQGDVAIGQQSNDNAVTTVTVILLGLCVLTFGVFKETLRARRKTES